MGRQIKGVTCGHIWLYMLLRLQGVYCWVRVYISTTGNILLSQGSIFWQLLVDWVVYSSTAKKFATAAQRNETFVFAMEGQFSPVLTRRATANTIEPPVMTVFSTYCTTWAQQPKRLTNFPGYSCSDTAYLVCWTTHGWTDATASRQL